MTQRVAVVGLGTMGGPMALNLIKAGFEVVVHNRTRERETACIEAGATGADTPRVAASGCGIVLVCVSDTPDVEAVVFGADGVAEGIGEGAVLVDCSTIAPAATREFAARLAERGAGWLDAPVSGGSEGAIAGTLAVMCGGTDDDFARARPVLDVIGGRVTHVGPVGAGQVAKAVNQVIIAGTYMSVAEGMVLAAKLDVDPRRVVDAIASGAAASWILDNRAGNMIGDDYPLGFRMRLHRKDLGIALDEAAASGARLDAAAFVAETEDALIAEGHGDEDMSAMARAVRRRSNMPDGPM